MESDSTISLKTPEQLAEVAEAAMRLDGVMHMISLSNIPMFVLFGPTNSDKFAPKRDNVIILDSKKLYNTSDISKISVDDVLKHLG